MPTYEYACKKCGEVFDVVQSFSDDPLKRHKGCGGTVKRVFSSVGISFKGSGFYKTDSRSSSSGGGGSKSNGESKGDSKSSDSSSSGSSSETKSDAKSESKPKPKTDTASTTS